MDSPNKENSLDQLWADIQNSSWGWLYVLKTKAFAVSLKAQNLIAQIPFQFPSNNFTLQERSRTQWRINYENEKTLIVWSEEFLQKYHCLRKTRRHLVTHGHEPKVVSILVWHQQGPSDKTNRLVNFFSPIATHWRGSSKNIYMRLGLGSWIGTALATMKVYTLNPYIHGTAPIDEMQCSRQL